MKLDRIKNHDENHSCTECVHLQFNKEFGGSDFSFMLSPIAMYLCPFAGRWWSYKPTNEVCDKFKLKDS